MDPGTFSCRSDDGRQLAGFRWAPHDDQTSAGVVVLVHGVGEHVRRYDHVADALTSQGFVVYGHDHADTAPHWPPPTNLVTWDTTGGGHWWKT